MKYFALLLAAGLGLAVGTVSAQTPQDALIAFGKTLTVPLRADFSEHQNSDVTTGVLTLGNKGKIRWEHKTPYHEFLVSNGTTAWFVEPELGQAVRLNPRAAKSWTSIFEAGALDLNYETGAKGRVIELRRRDTASDDWPNLDITLDAKGRPAVIVFVDGDKRRIELSGWSVAQRSQFDYTPTAGMEVIGDP